MFGSLKWKALTSSALAFLGEGRIAEAIEMLEKTITEKISVNNFENSYALAIAYQIHIGNGLKARHYFLKAWDLSQVLIPARKIDQHDERLMWTIHNSAQYAISWDEYKIWADRMLEYFPSAPLIYGKDNQYALIVGLTENGWTWPEILMEKAVSYSAPGNVRNMKRSYTANSCAAGIYQLMLTKCDPLDMNDSLVGACLSDYAANVSKLTGLYVRTYDRVDTSATVRLISDSIDGGRHGKPTISPAGTLSITIQDQIVFYQALRKMLESGFYKSADGLFEQVQSNDSGSLSFSNVLIPALFDLASMYWSNVGLGEKALECYEIIWNLSLQGAAIPVFDEGNDEAVAFSCENAMLLSVSPDEFIKWRNRLKELAPDNPIIHEIGENYISEYENGKPWYEVIAQMLPSYYNRNDPEHDRQRYGNAASLYRIMLLNRKELRLPRDIYKYFVTEYGILSLRLCAQDTRKFQNSLQKSPHAYTAEFPEPFQLSRYKTNTLFEDISWPVEAALPFVEEYVKKYPGDEELENMVYSEMKKIAISNSL